MAEIAYHGPCDPRINAFHNLHRGERLFILASGPSLNQLPLKRLAGRTVMGLNRSALAYPDTAYHCAMDRWLFHQLPDLLRRCGHLFTVRGRPFGVPLRLLDKDDPAVGSDGFSFDLTRGIYSGWTVAYFGLQVAVWMGFTEIVFLGLDLRHGPTTHFFGDDRPQSNAERPEIFAHMRRNFEAAAERLHGRGVSLARCGAGDPIPGIVERDFGKVL